MHQLIIWRRQIICCAPIYYLSGGVHQGPTLLVARLSYFSYIYFVITRALNVPCFNLLEARVGIFFIVY